MKTSLLFLLLVFSFQTLAKPEYVGSISINPSQDAKVLADWYAKLGIETEEYQGMFFGSFETAAGPFAFAVHAKRKDAPEKSSGSVSVVFRVKDYDKYLAEVEARGLKPNSVESDSEGHFAHFIDPDGNKISLWGN